MATFTTKTEYDDLKRVIDEQAHIAAQLYATPDADSEERSSEGTWKSTSETPNLKRSADSASLDGSNGEPYSPRYYGSLSPPPPSKKVRVVDDKRRDPFYALDPGQEQGHLAVAQPNELFLHKAEHKERLDQHQNLLNMSELLSKEYRDKRKEIRNNIMGDQPQMKLLTQSQLIYQLKRSLQKGATDAMDEDADPHTFEPCDRKLIGWNPTLDPDRSRLRKQKLEGRIQQQKQEIGKLERQLRSTSHKTRPCPYYKLGRCQFGSKHMLRYVMMAFERDTDYIYR